MRIALNDVMVVHTDALALQTLTVCIRRALTGVMGNNHRRDKETAVHKLFAQTEYVFIVGNTQVLAHLVSLYIFGREHDQDLQ